MTTPIYISASSAEWRRAKHWADKLLKTGLVTISDAWWDTAAAWAGTDGDVSQEVVRDAIRQHDAAIMDCDVFWFLSPALYSHGACQELGFARGIRAARQFPGPNPRIYVSGKCCNASIFWRDTDHELVIDSDQAAFDAIVASLRKVGSK